MGQYKITGQFPAIHTFKQLTNLKKQQQSFTLVFETVYTRFPPGSVTCVYLKKKKIKKNRYPVCLFTVINVNALVVALMFFLHVAFKLRSL